MQPREASTISHGGKTYKVIEVDDLAGVPAVVVRQGGLVLVEDSGDHAANMEMATHALRKVIVDTKMY